MPRIHIGSDDWEFRVGGVPPSKDWIDILEEHPSIDVLIHGLKNNPTSMNGLRTLCSGLSLQADQLSEDEMLSRIAGAIRSGRLRGYRKPKASDKKAKKDDPMADAAEKAAAAGQKPKPEDQKIVKVRIGPDDWEFQIGGDRNPKKWVELIERHRWLEPYLNPTLYNPITMAAFRGICRDLMLLPPLAGPFIGKAPVIAPQHTESHQAVHQVADQLTDQQVLDMIMANLRAHRLKAFHWIEDSGGGGNPPGQDAEDKKDSNQDDGSGGKKDKKSTEKKKTWVEFKVVDMEGNPVSGKAYKVMLPDGTVKEGKLDPSGMLRFDNIDPENSVFSLTDLDQEAWERI